MILEWRRAQTLVRGRTDPRPHRLDPGPIAGPAQAVGPADSTAKERRVIRACLNAETGKIRVVPRADDCRPSEERIRWIRSDKLRVVKRGPQGETGSAGATGAPGPAGPAETRTILVVSTTATGISLTAALSGYWSAGLSLS